MLWVFFRKCPNLLSFAVTEHSDQSNLRRKVFIWLIDYRPSWREAKVGSWSQELKQRPWRGVLLTGLLGYLC